MSFADCTITPVTSIICIPLPIGVLGKSGTLQDNNTNDKRHGREWWVGKNQNYLVRIKLKPSGKVSVVPPMSIYHVCIEKEVEVYYDARYHWG